MKYAVFFALVLISVILAEEKDDTKLLPADSFADNWIIDDKVQRFTQADLYGYINGGAEVFLELGFDQLTLQDYKHLKDEMSIEIYRMKDQVAATGIYLMKCGKENPDPELMVRNTVNKYQVLFHKNNYFVKIANHTGKKEYIPAMIIAASAIANLIPADKKIPELSLLPSSGLKENSIRLIRGQYTLQAIYTFGDGDILQLGGSATAVAADYDGPDSEAFTLIIVEYANKSDANKALAHLKKNLDKYLDVIEWKNDRFVLKDYNDEFVLGKISSNRLEIKVNIKKK